MGSFDGKSAAKSALEDGKPRAESALSAQSDWVRSRDSRTRYFRRAARGTRRRPEQSMAQNLPRIIAKLTRAHAIFKHSVRTTREILVRPQKSPILQLQRFEKFSSPDARNARAITSATHPCFPATRLVRAAKALIHCRPRRGIRDGGGGFHALHCKDFCGGDKAELFSHEQTWLSA